MKYNFFSLRIFQFYVHHNDVPLTTTMKSCETIFIKHPEMEKKNLRPSLDELYVNYFCEKQANFSSTQMISENKVLLFANMQSNFSKGHVYC